MITIPVLSVSIFSQVDCVPYCLNGQLNCFTAIAELNPKSSKYWINNGCGGQLPMQLHSA